MKFNEIFFDAIKSGILNKLKGNNRLSAVKNFIPCIVIEPLCYLVRFLLISIDFTISLLVSVGQD